MSQKREMVSIPKVAEIIGLSETWVRENLTDIPHYVLGASNTIRFDPEEIETWLKRQRQGPNLK